MIENRPKVSITEFTKIATEVLEPNRIPTILWGPTGIGKTDILVKLAKATERILRIYYPAGMEPPDLSGLPFDHPERVELVAFKKSEQIHFEPGEKYLIFIDEYNRATIDMQQALVALYNKRPYFGVHPLHESNLWIVTAMNDATLQEGVMVSEVDDALRTRSAQFILKPTTKEVGDYLAEIYPGNFIANFLRSPAYVSGAIEPDFANVYREPAYIMPTPRNFEMAARAVQGKSVPQIQDMYTAIQSMLGVAVIGAIEKYINNMKRLDPKLLFRGDDIVRNELDQYINAPVDQGIAQLILDAFNGALAIADDFSDEQVANFMRNLQYIEKKKDGSPAFGDVVGSVFAAVRLQNKRNVARIAARREFLGFFKTFHDNPGEAKK
jgi:hypothetical protein